MNIFKMSTPYHVFEAPCCEKAVPSILEGYFSVCAWCRAAAAPVPPSEHEWRWRYMWIWHHQRVEHSWAEAYHKSMVATDPAELAQAQEDVQYWDARR